MAVDMARRQRSGDGGRGVRARGDHRRGGRAADGAGDRRGNAAAAGREGARRPREGRRCGAAGARALEPPARDAQHRLRARARGLRAGAQRPARRLLPRRACERLEPGISRRHRRLDGVDGVMQIGAVVVLARVATQVRDIVATLQKDIRPLIGRANEIADEASRTAAIATAQAQKIDRLVTDLTRRVDETSAVVQQAIITPAREGMAIVAALKAGLGALRGCATCAGRPAGSTRKTRCLSAEPPRALGFRLWASGPFVGGLHGQPVCLSSCTDRSSRLRPRLAPRSSNPRSWSSSSRSCSSRRNSTPSRRRTRRIRAPTLPRCIFPARSSWSCRRNTPRRRC